MEDQAEKQVSCPYCSSTETELFSLFGQQLLTMQYYCNSCHTPFEYIKGDADLLFTVEAFPKASHAEAGFMTNDMSQRKDN